MASSSSTTVPRPTPQGYDFGSSRAGRPLMVVKGNVRGMHRLRSTSLGLSWEPQAFDGLTSEIGDQLEVVVEVENRELGQLGGRRVQQIRN